MEKYIRILQYSPLFAKINKDDIAKILQCFKSTISTYSKGTYIKEVGDAMTSLCLLLQGGIHIISDDYWGNQNIMSQIGPGDIFGESYVCATDNNLEVNIRCTEDSKVLNLNIHQILTPCRKSCPFHHQMILNLLSMIAEKNLILMKKLNHISQRTTRDKLLSYLNSQKIQNNGSVSFLIPFNRQQLADYLGVDRSAMSNELSKMKDEGLIEFHKNDFKLK